MIGALSDNTVVVMHTRQPTISHTSHFQPVVDFSIMTATVTQETERSSFFLFDGDYTSSGDMWAVGCRMKDDFLKTIIDYDDCAYIVAVSPNLGINTHQLTGHQFQASFEVTQYLVRSLAFDETDEMYIVVEARAFNPERSESAL